MAIKGKHGPALKTTDFTSPKAQAKLKKGETHGIVREHVVPVSVIVNKVSELKKPTEEEIVKIVKEWTIIAAITQEEDADLRKGKLSKTMPKNWNGCDLFARYRKVGIQVPK